MKRNVALLAGGYSGEYEVSMKSAQTISEHLDRDLFEVFLVDVRREGWFVKTGDATSKLQLDDFSLNIEGCKISLDYAYIIIHGSPGENGQIQGYLDMKGVPYNTGSVLNMALTFNKAATQRMMLARQIPIARHMICTSEARPTAEELGQSLGFPCFVKPAESGSSIGISKVKAAADIDQAIDFALDYSHEVIIECGLDGRELACTVYRGPDGVLALPATEIITQAEFFDYEAKYQDEDTQEITPADISEDAMARCQALAKQVYVMTGCDGIARADFFLCGEDLFLVEVNTVPGMSKESLVPKAMKAVDVDLKALLTWKIETDLAKKSKT